MTTFGIPPENPTDYTGPTKALTPQIKAPRAPLTTDKNHPIGTRWWDTATNDWYWLSNFESNGDATWKKYTETTSSSPLKTLTTDDSTIVVPVNNNIDLAGDSAQGVSTSGSGDTATITVADATTSTKGVASFNPADFTVILGEVSLTGGSAADTFTTDSGDANPVGGVLNILGGTNIATTGSGDTVTINFDGILPVTSGGTGQTSYTDGQLLIGNTTGNTLEVATLTEGEGIDITNGAGSITIASELATAGATVGAANIGAAAFDSADFDVTSGFVSLINPTSTLPNYESNVFYYCDFFRSTSNNYFENGFRGTSNAGTDQNFSTTDHPGVATFYSSVSDNDIGISLSENFSSTRPPFYIGGGQSSLMMWLRYETLPTVGYWGFGLLDARYTLVTEGAYFIVEDMSSSYDIVCRTRESSTDEDTSSGVNISTTWTKFEIVVNSAGSSIDFYINDTLEATHSTTIPSTSTSLVLGTFCGLNNGSASSTRCLVDYMEYKKELTGDRA